MARGEQVATPISDADKKAIVEAVVEGLIKSNRSENHDQLRSMFRLEAELARVKEELARSQAEVNSLQAYANQLLAVMRPSATPTYPTGIPGVPPVAYQVPTYPGSTVTAPVPPPSTVTIEVPAYGEYMYQNSGSPLNLPVRNGHATIPEQTPGE